MTLECIRRLLVMAPIVLAFGWGGDCLMAQDRDSLGLPVLIPDSLQAALPGDSTSTAVPTDTLATTAPVRGPRSGGSGKVVTFSASDSLILDLVDGHESVHLIGDAKVGFDKIALEAHAINFRLNESELHASGLEVDTGMVGRPTFTSGEETFGGKTLAYNLDSGKGRVVQGRTQIADGFLFAEVSKSLPDSTLYALNAIYTTCLVDTSYSLRASRVKIVNGKQTYTGPLHIRIFNIPLPFWLPFGVLPPNTEGRKSGPIAPSYGEDPDRGFFIRDFGWYFALNEYMDFQTQFGFWTLGSWQIRPQFRYNKRYNYSGTVSLDWVKNKRGERGDPDIYRQQVTTRSFRWNHNQTVSPSATFTADVNLSSRGYLRGVSTRYNDQVRQSMESNLNFTKRWSSSGKTLTAYASHRQILSTGEVNSTLPRFKFSQRTTSPFKRSSSGGDERWYEKITYAYTGEIDNRFAFKPDTSLAGAADITWFDALVSRQQYEDATGDTEPFEFKARHQIPVSAAFAMERLPIINRTFRLNLTPRFNYAENWYARTEQRSIDPDAGTLTTERIAGFKAIRTYSAGFGANTEFYGLFPLSIGRFQGLRHVVRPNISFNLQPDFSSDRWGYYGSYEDTSGTEIRYPVVSGIPTGERRQLTFSVNNVFQTRSVRVDSTGETQRKTVQLLTLNMGSSFNFAADSLRLAPVTLNARTRILDRFDFNLTSSFSPYARNDKGRDINRYLFDDKEFPLRLRMLSFTARTTVGSGRQTGPSRPVESGGGLYGNNDPRFGDPSSPFFDPSAPAGYGSGMGYADFAIPWSLDLDFTYNITRTSLNPTRRAILNTGFDFNLTPNWKIRGRSGYDFVEGEVVTTQINIIRDLNCWEMSLNWTPFGTYQSFQFSLNVKSGKLREYLKLRHPRTEMRNRFDVMQ